MARPALRRWLERLEDRTVPVVGFYSFAQQVMRGGFLDGVVLVEHDSSFGTGSLLESGRHILTAAHVVSTSSDSTMVTFHLNRGTTDIDITLEVPRSAVVIDPLFNGQLALTQGNDLALLTLIDQVDQHMSRHLVAPYGAQRYAFYSGNLDGEVFTLVGYGRTGTGRYGNQVDEVQRIQISNPTSDGTFTLTFEGQTTAPISQTANREEILAALTALSNLGDNVEVNDYGLPTGCWEVRFLGEYGNRDVAELTGTVEGGGKITITELFAGGNSELARIKRMGYNEIDLVEGPFLRFDFDNGTDEQNSMGSTGLGPFREAGLERGDSGSPLLLEQAGAYALAGVFSYFSTGGEHDYTNYATPDGSFGSTGTYVNTLLRQTGFLQPAMKGAYHLVLDMQQQVLGLDGIVENLLIRVFQDRGDLVLQVDGSSDPRFNGEYYRAPIGEILSLTLRGSEDNETFIVEGELPLRSITIDGRQGNDTLWLDNRLQNEWAITGVNRGTVRTNSISFSKIANLHGGEETDVFAFHKGGEITGNVDGYLGLDRLDYSAFGSSITTSLRTGTTSAIGGFFLGIEGVLGSQAKDFLVGDDRPNSWWITGANLGNVNGFTFASIENLFGGGLEDRFVFEKGGSLSGSVDGGDHWDTLDYSKYPSSITLNLQNGKTTGVQGTFEGIESLVGSKLMDTLIGPHTATNWSLLGEDQGRVGELLTFLAVERLIGGKSRDIFTFSSTGKQSGAINGGPGVDWLDYRQLAAPVLVNLSAGVATHTGGVGGIEHVLGSLVGANRLIGNSANNILVGFGINNHLRGMNGRDLLIGGSANAYLAGGLGEDVVLAGATVYDHDILGLQTFLAEWTRNLSYTTRVNNLIYGRGLTRGRRLAITAPTRRVDTVLVEAAPGTALSSAPMKPTIYGNQGMDFFVVRSTALVQDLDRNRERVI